MRAQVEAAVSAQAKAVAAAVILRRAQCSGRAAAAAAAASVVVVASTQIGTFTQTDSFVSADQSVTMTCDHSNANLSHSLSVNWCVI